MADRAVEEGAPALLNNNNRAETPTPATATGELAPLPGESATWYRAGAHAPGPSVGLAARVWIGRPRTGTREHSLAELSVETGFLHRNVVEVGWQVSPTRYGDADPHLFVFHWVRGAPRCYDGCGFVPLCGGVPPGMSLNRDVGRWVDFGLVSSNGDWWVWVGEAWVGHFPAELWGEEAWLAQSVQWFGEVLTFAAEPVSEMGSGAKAGQPEAASFRDLCDVDLDSWTCRGQDAALRATNPERYDALRRPDGSVAYGGPGQLLTARRSTVTPPRPPSSASGETPAARGRSGTSPPR